MRRLAAVTLCASLLAIVGSLGLAGCAGQGGTPADLNSIAGRPGNETSSPDAFHFVVLSDRTGGADAGAWAKAVEQVNRLRPDFVMCIGDLTQGYTDDEAAIRTQWADFDKEIASLKAPFFYCPGNHDVEDPAPRKVYTELHGKAGKTYYSFDYRGRHFVVLDTSPWVYPNKGPKDIADAQWEWLKRDLAAARDAKQVFLFVHYPVFDSKEIWGKLRPMLDASKTVLFCGHTHVMTTGVQDGIPCYMLAPTAALIEKVDKPQGVFQMFAQVAVDKGRPSVAFIGNGDVLPEDYNDRRIAAMRVAALRGAVLTPVSRDGGACKLVLVNNSKLEVEYAARWNGGEPFFEVIPEGTTLPGRGSSFKMIIQPNTAPAGSPTNARVDRACTVGKCDPAAPPTVEVQAKFLLDGKPCTVSKTLTLPVVEELKATRVDKMTLDGKLDAWPGSPAAARILVEKGKPANAAEANCSAHVYLAYDDRNLYVCVDVKDDKIVTEGKEAWKKDGVEIFWDPRGLDDANQSLRKPCGQILIPVPPAGQAAKVEGNAELGRAELDKQIKAVCVTTDYGYVIQAAIPFKSIAEGFDPTKGKAAARMLRMNFVVNDKDAPNGETQIMTVSGDDKPWRGTAYYAIVRFK